MANLELPFGVKPTNPLSNLDKARYGAHNTIQDALIATAGTRELGLTVGIIENGSVVEYWFKEGIADTDLIVKTVEATGGIDDAPNDGEPYVRQSESWQTIENQNLNWTGQHTFTDIRLPSSIAPVMNQDGDIATDTVISGMSHGLIKHYAGEELVAISMPIAQLSALNDGWVVKYNATSDEFELQPELVGGEDNIFTTINNINYDSTEGTNSMHGFINGLVDGINDEYTVSKGEYVSGKLKVSRNGKELIQGANEDWIELIPSSGTFKMNTPPTIGDILTVEYVDKETTIENVIYDKPTTTKSINYTATEVDRNLLVNTSTGDKTITLPPVNKLDSIGITIKKVDTSGNNVIITTPNSETIDNQTSYTFSGINESIKIITDGVNYFIV